MRAEVTKEFRGKSDGETAERYFAVGEVIGGELAKVAVDAGNAEEIKDKPAKAKK